MKRTLTALLLALAMLAGLVVFPAAATDAADTVDRCTDWYGRQLSGQGRRIYDALNVLFQNGTLQDGAASVDLTVPIGQGTVAPVSQEGIAAYLSGNQNLMQDFAAAKYAFSMDHPAACYIDTSRLTLRIFSDKDGKYHAVLGPGGSGSFHMDGVSLTKADVTAIQDSLMNAARKIGIEAGALDSTGLSQADRTARQIQYVHDQVIRTISQRNETVCTEANISSLGTASALLTHEGNANGYARAVQYVLQIMGLPNVLLWGTRATENGVEVRLWNAVQVAGTWYMLDAAWDDPVRLSPDGSIAGTSTPGVDGGENDLALLKGLDETGLFWHADSSYTVGSTVFTIPQITGTSLDSSALPDAIVLKATQTENKDGWQVSFRGRGAESLTEDGLHILVRRLSALPDGTLSPADSWEYAEALVAKNSSFCLDADGGLLVTTGAGAYLQFAVTAKAPEDGLYTGNGTDILGTTPLLYNSAAPATGSAPQVSAHSLSHLGTVAAGATYNLAVSFDDDLIRPTPNGTTWASPDQEVYNQSIQVRYTATKTAAGDNAEAVSLQGWSSFDKDHNGLVDPDVLQWHWACAQEHSHSIEICPVDGVSFPWDPSTDPADGGLTYTFQVEGLAGTRSGKLAQPWSVSVSQPTAESASQPDANLWSPWSSPILLDSIDSLDLSRIACKDPDGEDKYLKDLAAAMRHVSLDGRLSFTGSVLTATHPAYAAVYTAAMNLVPYLQMPKEDMLATSLLSLSFADLCGWTVTDMDTPFHVLAPFPEGASSANGFRAFQLNRGSDGLLSGAAEIPAVKTPNGLILTCSGMDPVMIVEVDTEKAPKESRTVVLVAEDGGNLQCRVGGKDNATSGAIVSLSVDETVTVSIQPPEGYAVDRVIANNGVSPAVNGQNSFTLSAADVPMGVTLVQVSFVSAGGKEAENTEGLTPSALRICSHSHTSLANQTDATCTTDGSTGGVFCQDCGQTLQPAAAIPALGHRFGEAVPSGTGDCTQRSLLTYICQTCGAQEQRTVAAAATHQYGAPTVIKERTCQEDGLQTVTCTVCGHTEEVVLPSTGEHHFSAVFHKEQATCTEPGADLQVCLDCGFELVTEIPAPGHDFSLRTEIKPATCTEGGLVRYICSVCGKWSMEYASEPLGHTYEDGACIRCGAKEAVPFTDVPAQEWYFDAVAYMYHHSLVAGTSPTTFDPDGTCTRSMIVVLLWNMSGSPVSLVPNQFTDCPAEWYQNGVNWANANGIVSGDGAGHFYPDTKITKEQLVTILMNYARYRGLDVSKRADLSGFADYGDVDECYMDAMRWAMGSGYLQAAGDRLGSDDDSLRKDLAWILYQFCSSYELY